MKYEYKFVNCKNEIKEGVTTRTFEFEPASEWRFVAEIGGGTLLFERVIHEEPSVVVSLAENNSGTKGTK